MYIDYKKLEALALITANAVSAWRRDESLPFGEPVRVYAVPRGGISAALAMGKYFELELVQDPKDADIFIDDLIDSGSTMRNLQEQHPGKPFFALIDKRRNTNEDGTSNEYFCQWVVFPWEESAENGVEDNIRRILQFVGDNPAREGLLETPRRVAKAWAHWCSGYNGDPAKLLKVFKDGAEAHNQMVTVKDIPIYSHCEHHMAPIFGTVTISYIPDGMIVGLSKLSRLANMYARRLQVQERLTDQIADALWEHLKPKGVGVVIKARHLCMESRGICQQGHHTVTTALRGAMLDEPETRAEFLQLAR